VDLTFARSVLRLDPAIPLTPEVIEQAYAHESWERHPSRYPEGDAKQAAEAWAGTLAEARASLLDAATTADGAAAPVARRGLSRGAIIGIVAGGLALVAVLVIAGIVAVQVARQFGEQFAAPPVVEETVPGDEAGTAEPGDEPGDDEIAGGDATPEATDPNVERLEASETFFTFPAAIEFYSDGRYGHLCGLEYLEGCWESALFTEQDCAALEIDLGFANDIDAIRPEETRMVTEAEVAAGEATPVVFGNDAYDYGWVENIRCTS
jgi:hypothetical protein